MFRPHSAIPILLLAVLTAVVSFQAGRVRHGGNLEGEIDFGRRAHRGGQAAAQGDGRILSLPIPGPVEATDPTVGVEAPNRNSEPFITPVGMHMRSVSVMPVMGGLGVDPGRVAHNTLIANPAPASVALLGVGVWLIGPRYRRHRRRLAVYYSRANALR